MRLPGGAPSTRTDQSSDARQGVVTTIPWRRTDTRDRDQNLFLGLDRLIAVE